MSILPPPGQALHVMHEEKKAAHDDGEFPHAPDDEVNWEGEVEDDDDTQLGPGAYAPVFHRHPLAPGGSPRRWTAVSRHVLSGLSRRAANGHDRRARRNGDDRRRGDRRRRSGHGDRLRCHWHGHLEPGALVDAGGHDNLHRLPARRHDADAAARLDAGRDRHHHQLRWRRSMRRHLDLEGIARPDARGHFEHQLILAVRR